VLVIVTTILLTGCRDESPFDSPELGASRGEVQLVPHGELAPTSRIELTVEADGTKGLLGSSCLKIYEWAPGFGPSPDWVLDHGEDTWTPVDQGEEPCSLGSEPLPATFAFRLPDLDEGTYQIAYDWTRPEGRSGGQQPASEGSAEYTFVVD
jgi:hypothetical protein